MLSELLVEEVRGPADVLFHRYPRESGPRDVFLEVDPQARSLRVDWDPEVGNAVPEPVWARRRFRFFVSWPLTAAGANALLRDATVHELAAALLAGHCLYRDAGGRWAGELDEAAAVASERLAELVADWGDGPECPDGYRVNVIDAFDWFSGLSGTGADWAVKLAAALGVAASTTDDELAEVVADEAAAALSEGYHVVDGLAVFLADLRERLTAVNEGGLL